MPQRGSDFITDTALGSILRFALGRNAVSHQEESNNLANVEKAAALLYKSQSPPIPPTNLTQCKDGIGSGEYLDAQIQAINCPTTLPLVDGKRLEIHQGLRAAPSSENALVEITSPSKLTQDVSVDAVIVGWYDSNDTENPKNWPQSKKLRVYFIINYVNATTYMSSSIYTASQNGIAAHFGVSRESAGLGLALVVLGYGFGPLLFSPLADITWIGRNPPYILSHSAFMIISVLAATANSFPGLLCLRFLQGFFASPLVTFGGASLTDICDESIRPYALYSWALSGFVATSIAPVISGFSIPSLGWRWPLWEIVLANGPALVLLFLLPETSAVKILYNKARRLCTAHPGTKFVLPTDSNTGLSTKDILHGALIIPWKMHALDPSILFTSLYTGLVYGIYYSFFEVFPLVFANIYGFNLGEMGLAYTAVAISVGLVGIPYCGYIYYVSNTERKAQRTSQLPEHRLVPAIIASVLIPGGMFLTGWTARADFHWIVPLVGVGLTAAGVVVILQCVFVYISLVYPRYAASVFGGNGFIRCSIAFGAVLWSNPLYSTTSIGVGSTIIGGVSVLEILGIVLLFKYGDVLRGRSRFTS